MKKFDEFFIFYRTRKYHVSLNYNPQKNALTSDIMDKSNDEWEVVSSLTQEFDSKIFKNPFNQLRNMIKLQREMHFL